MTLRSAWRAVTSTASLGAALVKAHGGSTRPFKATIVLTERCDCRCEICRIWEKPKGREPTPQEIATFLRSAGGIRWLNLTGGEIFLREDVEEICAKAFEAEPRLAVLDFPTTGQRTDRIVETVGRIAKLGVPRFFVTVSVEGPPALHDVLRGRPGAFDHMIETYRRLRGIRGVKAYLGFTLSDRNADAVDETFRVLASRIPRFSEREVHVNVATTSGHYYANLAQGVRRPARPRAAIRRVLSHRRTRWTPTDWLESTYLSLVPRHAETGRSPLPCKSLTSSVFVAPDGTVHPCTVYGRPLGNAWSTPLPEILSTPEADAARLAVKEDRCPGCWSPCEAYQTILSDIPRALLAR